MQSLASANVTTRTTDWNSINWRKSTKIVRNLNNVSFGHLKKLWDVRGLLEPCAVNVASTVRRELRHEAVYVFVITGNCPGDDLMFCHQYPTQTCVTGNSEV